MLLHWSRCRQKKTKLAGQGVNHTYLEVCRTVARCVSHSKNTWLPFVAALWPLPFTPSAVCVCEHVKKEQDQVKILSLMDFVTACMSRLYESQAKWAGSELYEWGSFWEMCLLMESKINQWSRNTSNSCFYFFGLDWSSSNGPWILHSVSEGNKIPL